MLHRYYKVNKIHEPMTSLICRSMNMKDVPFDKRKLPCQLCF